MARKTTTSKKVATPQVEAVTADTDAQPVIKKPDLLDEVVKRTGLKKRDVKPAIEAALAVMLEKMRDGNDLVLPPLGKLRVVKTKDLDGGAAVLTLKLRAPKHASIAAATPSDDDL